jgi:hypothetical protein
LPAKLGVGASIQFAAAAFDGDTFRFLFLLPSTRIRALGNPPLPFLKVEVAKRAFSRRMFYSTHFEEYVSMAVIRNLKNLRISTVPALYFTIIIQQIYHILLQHPITLKKS